MSESEFTIYGEQARTWRSTRVPGFLHYLFKEAAPPEFNFFIMDLQHAREETIVEFDEFAERFQ